jgi:hypothetical protein
MKLSIIQIETIKIESKKLIISEINLTVGNNSEAGSAEIQEIRSDQFRLPIYLSRATVFVKKIANNYYIVVIIGVIFGLC